MKKKQVSLFTVEEKKVPYGELEEVMLTPNEYQKLVDKLGEGLTQEMITDLDLYIARNKNSSKYKSHYAVILAWVRRQSRDHYQSRLKKGKGIVGL